MSLTQRINQHADVLRKMSRSLTNIEQRLAFLEVKADQAIKTSQSGNNTRNLIAVVVVVKILFEGVASVNSTNLEHVTNLLKLLGG